MLMRLPTICFFKKKNFLYLKKKGKIHEYRDTKWEVHRV